MSIKTLPNELLELGGYPLDKSELIVSNITEFWEKAKEVFFAPNTQVTRFKILRPSVSSLQRNGIGDNTFLLMHPFDSLKRSLKKKPALFKAMSAGTVYSDYGLGVSGKELLEMSTEDLDDLIEKTNRVIKNPDPKDPVFKSRAKAGLGALSEFIATFYSIEKKNPSVGSLGEVTILQFEYDERTDGVQTAWKKVCFSNLPTPLSRL